MGSGLHCYGFVLVLWFRLWSFGSFVGLIRTEGSARDGPKRICNCLGNIGL